MKFRNEFSVTCVRPRDYPNLLNSHMYYRFLQVCWDITAEVH